MDHVQSFVEFLCDNGLAPADRREIILDDRCHRFRLSDERVGKDSSTYQVAVDGDFAFGWVRSHKMAETLKYSSGKKGQWTAEQKKEFAARMRAQKEAAALDRENQHVDAALAARQIWAGGETHHGKGFPPHPYAMKKNFDLPGLKVERGNILVPLYDVADGKIWNLQRIDKSGGKKFLPGGRVNGLAFPLGRRVLMCDQPFVFCEGVATGKTLERVLELPVVCAMVAGNLEAVAKAYRRKYKYARFLFAADFDMWTMDAKIKAEKFADVDLKQMDGADRRFEEWRKAGYMVNIGQEKAEAAAKAVDGVVVSMPESLRFNRMKPTDFNDLSESSGDAIIRQIFKAYL